MVTEKNMQGKIGGYARLERRICKLTEKDIQGIREGYER